MPWYCQKCGKVTENSDELLYDTEIVPGTCRIKITDHFVCKDRIFEVRSYKKTGDHEYVITTCGNFFFLNQFEFVAHVEN